MSQYDKVYTHEGQSYEFNYSDVEELMLLPLNKTNILTGEKVRIEFSFSYNQDLGIVVMRGQYDDIVGTSVGIDRDKMADTIFQSLVDRTPIDNMQEVVHAKEQIISLFSQNYITKNLLLDDYKERCVATISLEKETIGEAYEVNIKSGSSGKVNLILDKAFLADSNIKGEYTVRIDMPNVIINFKSDDYTIDASVIDKITFSLSSSSMQITEAVNEIAVKEVNADNAEEIRRSVNSRLTIFNENDEDEDFLDFDLD